ncbi:RNase adapter RapZ [Bacillus marinisedimentorum]|uniref:RNase adapter RapZ n=1 Tax=Bacillus marinisedimentorum TaxID=1821260 RepID=UPI000D08D890|nr:RNase adapter RapZ [Bacillus marinisedimentorum]
MAETSNQMVVITGMSGAGKSVAMQALEDLGFFCVDNMPPTLLPKFLELVKESRTKLNKVALVMDLRGREFFEKLSEVLDEIESEEWIQPQILFLDANDSVLVRRYKETRRSHPLAPEGLPLEGIRQERALLSDLKGKAQQSIDTSDLRPRQLREKVLKRFADSERYNFNVNIVSFGFKFGIPLDADLVFDVRFLPNPHYIDEMRPLTGLDEVVSNYVMKWPETQTFVNKLLDLLTFMLPEYKREGKSQLVIAIGCTGGQHRSVTLAEYLGDYFSKDYDTHVSHREMQRKERAR